MTKEKTRFFSKKQAFLSVLLAVVITLTSVFSTMSSIIAYAAADSIISLNNTTVLSDAPSEKLASKYEFFAKFITGKSTVTTFGDGWTETAHTQGGVLSTWSIIPTSSQKGNIGVIYNNVGTYDGKEVSLKITIHDWYSTSDKPGYISYSYTEIFHQFSGYTWVDQQWQFIDASTGEPIKVSGYVTVGDVDLTQWIQFDTNTSKAIDDIYVADYDNWIMFENVGGEYKFSGPEEASNNSDPWAMFTFTYTDRSELRFKWGGRDFVGSEGYAEGEIMVFTSEKPLRSETAVPAKTVSDNDETNVTNNAVDEVTDTFTYSVYHNVPDEWEQFFYKGYVFSDSICNVLDIQSVKIYNLEGTDVTSKFDISTVNNTVTASAKSSFLSSADFYNNNYRFDIQVMISDSADLTPYIVAQTDQFITYSFPNMAELSIDGDSASSNNVTTEYREVIPDEPVYPSIDKKIVDDSALVDSLTIPRENREITFKSTFAVTNQVDLESVVVSDTLEVPFTYKSLVIYDEDGNDVTSWGNVAVNGRTVTFTFNSTRFADIKGKTFTLNLSVNYDSSYDLIDYVYGVIPNRIDLITNGDYMHSNEVTVTPAIETEIYKKIEDGSNLVDYKEIEYKDQIITFYGSAAFTNQEELTSAVISDTLEAPFTYQSLRVYNSKGEDITSKGSVSVSGQVVKFTFYTSYLDHVAGQTFTLRLNASYDSTADLNGYINAEIPNELTIAANGNPTPSTEVFVKPNVPTEITKQIFTKDDYVDYLRVENVLQTVTYHGTAAVSNAEQLTSVIISDTLEAPLSYVNGSFVVYDSKGNDISGKGKLNVDGQTITFSFNSDYLKYLAGHDISWDFKVSFNPSADLSRYINCELPNVFTITVNNNPTTSEKVIVVPDITTEIAKYIIDNGNYVSSKTIDDTTQEIEFYGEFTVGNQKTLTSVVFRDILEESFTYKSLVIFDSNGNDVTGSGTIIVNGQVVTFEFDGDYLKHVGGKSFTVFLTVTYDSDSDLSGYDSRMIPNVMELIVNGNTTASNQVTVNVNENIGVVDYNTDMGSALRNLLSSAKTGDYDIMLVLLLALSAMVITSFIHIKKKIRHSK